MLRGERGRAIIQRIEPLQPRLLGRTFEFLDYFWSIALVLIRATITPRKVCEIVSAQELIRAGEGAGGWKIEQPKPSISPISFAESNLHLFPGFLDRWTGLDRLYNLRQRKSFVRERLGGVRGRWPIDRGFRGPASRSGFGGGKLSLGHEAQWLRDACRE